MRLCFVIQRYGLEVAGGAELHCRQLASRLAARHDVEVLTTCALDYIEWRNHYPPGPDRVGDVRVTRFPVARPRSERRFARASEVVFSDPYHSAADERDWVVENGPFCPPLLAAVKARPAVDFFVFYSYRYYHSFFGIPAVADRTVLVPTAEEDAAIELPIFADLFRRPRGLVYLTLEERELVQRVSGNHDLPSVVIGSGVDIVSEEAPPPATHLGLPDRYVLYVGRIDRNKGADQLLEHMLRLYAEWPEAPVLVLVGKPALPIPSHPRIRHLGFVSEEEKVSVLTSARLLVMPSRYESLSIVVLEAWARGKPVLVSSECKVLAGQCLRSGGGLFYKGYDEFAATLRRLDADEALRRSLGEAGRDYVRREYAWPVLDERLEELFRQLSARAPATSRARSPEPRG